MSVMEKGILGGYKWNESSIYNELKNSLYWSFIHDGINKFSSEPNGIYIRYLDAGKIPYSFPYTLTKVRGDLKAYGLACHLIDEIRDILEVQGSTFETAVSKVSKYVEDKIFPVPPNCFNLGRLKKVDIEEKNIIIEASNSIPVGNYRDGVAINTKAARIMFDQYSIPASLYRCSTHSSDGTLK